jgi:hypothetical protein
MSRLTNSSAKLLWIIGAVKAFALVMYAVLYYMFGEFGGATGTAPAIGMIVGGLLVVALGATYRRVFKDNWPA